jgi:hypothetical protein
VSDACSTPGREDNALKGFDGKPKGKRKLRRPGLKWDDIIKIYLKDIGSKDLD